MGNPEARQSSSEASGRVTWARRSELAPFSPAPGIQVQPVIGESIMTCWITIEPNGVVAEHSHPNEQLGVVVAGSVFVTADGETREAVAGDAYVVPSGVVHSAVAGPDGVSLVESFVPVRTEYVEAWRAAVAKSAT